MESVNRGRSYRKIGQGFCGTVWAFDVSEDTVAIKREDGAPSRFVHNDLIMHRKAFEVLSTSEYFLPRKGPATIPPNVHAAIPRCHEYITNDSSWWNHHLSRFPANFSPCNALITDRIPAVPKEAGLTLIDRYCPDIAKNIVKASDADRDCLVRIYLGRRRIRSTHDHDSARPSRLSAFSLRNYPLHINQMEELGFEITTMQQYAEVMANTLARLYWVAHIDANDVEFVLAPLRKDSPADTIKFSSEFLGEHTLWILDFDCCREMAQDRSGVEQAVSAFYRNDPYFPRPGRANEEDKALWNTFKERFLATSQKILGDSDLPRLWVDLVESK